MFHNVKQSNGYDEMFFDKLYQKYINNTLWSRLRLKQVLKMVQPRAGEKILDLGCASGAISDFCGKFGANVTGIDLSSSGIKYAKKKFERENVAFAVADVSSIEIAKDGSFDKAVAADFIEHIDKNIFDKMLKEVNRILKTGGTISIYTPNPKHLIERLKAKNIVLKQNPTHIGLKCMEEIKISMEKAGFKIDTFYYCNSYIPVFKWVESLFMDVPWIGDYFRYRICVRGVKV